MTDKSLGAFTHTHTCTDTHTLVYIVKQKQRKVSRFYQNISWIFLNLLTKEFFLRLNF